MNPLNSPVKTTQLGEDVCCLEHIGQVYNKFMFDQHGLRLEDVKRTDCQNWNSAQRLCGAKAKACLWELKVAIDTHKERTLGLKMHLQVCARYIICDIGFEGKNNPSF